MCLCGTPLPSLPPILLAQLMARDENRSRSRWTHWPLVCWGLTLCALFIPSSLLLYIFFFWWNWWLLVICVSLCLAGRFSFCLGMRALNCRDLCRLRFLRNAHDCCCQGLGQLHDKHLHMLAGIEKMHGDLVTAAWRRMWTFWCGSTDWSVYL